MVFNDEDFRKIIEDFLLTYKQFLVSARMHQKVGTDLYKKNISTWNTILRSLEAGVVVGLNRILERKDDLGRKFEDEKVNTTAKKIDNLRHSHFGHFDISKMRLGGYLQENQIFGSDLIDLIDAIKKRLITYQSSYKLNVNVDQLFRSATQESMSDFESWMIYFKK